MSRPRIELDFARRPRRVSRRGVALLALGVSGAALVLAQYQSDLTQRSILEARLADINAARIEPTLDKAADRLASDSRAALAELTMPWSRLLQELERASAEGDGRVAVLGVEPDREKHLLRVIAEARTLPIALAYVQRLQVSDALRYPMLENHEVQTRDPEKPVRFQIRAEWRTP